MRTLTYYVAVTADGFTCGPDGRFDFFPLAEDVKEYAVREYPEAIPSHAREHLGIDAPNRRFDTLLQGRTSYQIALDEGITSPYAHMRQYVFSTTLPPGIDPAVGVVSGDPCSFVRTLKQEEGGLGLCLVGGSRIAGALLEEIDELLVKRYPIVAGAGLPVFTGDFAPASFERVATTTFDSGADFTLFRRG